MTRSILLASAAAAILSASPAFAQAQPADSRAADGEATAGAAAPEADQPTPGSAAAAHPDEDQAIVVTGTRRPAGDVLGGVSVVDEEKLAHDMKPSLGDTLADLPGVSSSSFGPSSSRPILRGLSGEDAPILIDGLTSLDLS